MLWCVRFLQRQSMHPDDYHMKWRLRHKLHPADWGVVQHQMALKSIALAGCNDQLDLPNCAFAEHLLREAQMIEYYYRTQEREADEAHKKEKQRAGMPMVEMELFLGGAKSSYDSMIMPDLVEHVSRALERDSAIMKQSRKAREERALARKS